MKEYNSHYLGMVMNNSDPEYRGRVQVFIPHIMPTLYEGWNKDGNDVEISCVGSNIPDGLDPIVHARLCQILPWAEAASPIIGSSAPGNLFSDVAQGIVSAANAAVGAVQSLFVQTPTSKPTTIAGPLGQLYTEASKYLGSGDLAAKGLTGFQTGESQGACARSTVALIGAMTGDKALQTGSAGGNAGQFALGGDLSLPSSSYQAKKSVTQDYLDNSSQWKPGDVIACQNNGVGHIFTYTGVGDKPWSSDFATASPQIGPSARNCALHEPTPDAQSRIASNLSRLYGQISSTGSSSGAEQGSSSGLQAAPNELAKVDAATVATAPTPKTTISGGGQGISGTISGGGTVSTTTASPGMKAALAAIAQGESGFSVKEANTNFYNALTGPGRNANVVREYNINGGNLADAQAKYGDYGFFQANDATEGQTVYNYLKSQGKDETTAQYYRDAITNNKGTGNFSLQDQTQAAVYLFAGDKKLAGTKAALDQLDSNDPNFKQKAANLIMQHKNKWFGIDEGVAAGATDPNSSSFAKINGTELVNAQNIVTAGISSSVVNNTDGNGRTPVINTNDMANGLFAYPNPGAMVWVFFREGNPLFPVYFAASYSSAEWKSAYRGGSPAVGQDYDTSGIRGTGSIMKLGPEGGILSQNRTNINDPLDSGSSLSLFHGEGSNITFKNGCDFQYSKNNKRDEVEGDKFVITRGYKEQWVEGDDSLNVRGNVIVKVGKFDQEALDAMKFISDFSNELNQTLMQNSKA